MTKKGDGKDTARRETLGRPPSRVRWAWSPSKFRAALERRQVTAWDVERWLRRCDPPVIANVTLYTKTVVPAVETAAALAEALGCEVSEFMEPVPPKGGGEVEE
jgi:hypothetical protein